MNAVLNKLVGDLVPVRGRAIEYVTVKAADQDWVVHRQALRQLQQRFATASRALDVVAVAEASLFWKDIRRVLFAGSRYSLLCRIGRDGLHDNWTPIKLVDVVREFVPEMAEQIGAAGQNLLAAASSGSAAASQGGDSDARMRKRCNYTGRRLPRGLTSSGIPHSSRGTSSSRPDARLVNCRGAAAAV